MLYLVAVLLPPLAVLLAGKPFQAILNLVLTLLFYVPGLIHALFVVTTTTPTSGRSDAPRPQPGPLTASALLAANRSRPRTSAGRPRGR